VFLEISLLAVFSEWLIFTACKMLIVAISRMSTSAVRVFPFFMVNWINVIFDKVNAIRAQITIGILERKIAWHYFATNSGNSLLKMWFLR
jgi:hypothetical protein